MKTMFVGRFGNVSVYRHPNKGFCVIAACDMPKGKLVCVSPVGRIGFTDLKKRSSFNDYPMAWDNKSDVIAFGPINLLNHAEDSNIRVERDVKRMLAKAYAKRDLEKGEELTLHYRCTLWFKIGEPIRV